MEKPRLFGRSIKEFLAAFGPAIALIVIILFVAHKYMDPAPPKQFVISTGEGDGDYQSYAEIYKDIIKDEGINLVIKSSKGTWENLNRLKDDNSDVEVGFVDDGLGNSDKAPNVSSLGSLYYEPLWIFYRGKTEITRFSQLKGKKIGLGIRGSGTHTISRKLLTASGVDENNSHLENILPPERAEALKQGHLDVGFFIATSDDPIIKQLVQEKSLRLMNLDQAEAITRQFPFLHHLVLPHGGMDLKENIPSQDTNMVASTATLLVKDSLHPALAYLLLKTISQVHGSPDVFEKKNEFPIDKDYSFPLSDEAKRFYKSGLPFWQKYLPFWLAVLIDRFILIVIPGIAVVLPLVKSVPRYMQWRIKNRIYQRYGELKFLETQVTKDRPEKYADYMQQLDKIEDRVNRMKTPLDFSEYVYNLKSHIHLVREKLNRQLG